MNVSTYPALFAELLRAAAGPTRLRRPGRRNLLRALRLPPKAYGLAAAACLRRGPKALTRMTSHTTRAPSTVLRTVGDLGLLTWPPWTRPAPTRRHRALAGGVRPGLRVG